MNDFPQMTFDVTLKAKWMDWGRLWCYVPTTLVVVVIVIQLVQEVR